MATITLDLPTPRYKCKACGGLTRFNVVRTVRVRSFCHFNLGDELVIEKPEVITDTVEQVICVYCGNGEGIEIIGPSTSG